MIKIGDAVVTITGDIEDLNTKLGEVDKQVKDSIGNIEAQARKIGVAFTLVGGAIVAGLTLAAKAAADEEAGIQRLSIALKNVGVEYDSVKESLEGVILATQDKTTVSDGEQRKSIAALVAITGDYNRSLDLLPLALDLAAGKGMDLASASEIVGRVAEGNTTILTRYGIQIREGATATEALGLLQQRFAGQAAAYGRTTAGQFIVLKNAIGDLVETIGTSLLPVVKSIIAIVKPLINNLENWIKENQVAANAILLVAGSVGTFMVLTGPLLIALPSIASGFVLLSKGAALLGFSLTALALPVIALAAGLAILSLGLILLADVNAKNARMTVLNKEALEEYNKQLKGEANNYSAVLEEQIKLIESYPELHANDLEWIKNAKARLAVSKEIDMAMRLEQGRIEAQILANIRFSKQQIDAINEKYGILDAKEKSFTVSLMNQARNRYNILKTAVDTEIRTRQKAHDTSMANLDKEYARTLRNFDAETGFRIAGVQALIDQIDRQTEIENRATDEKERKAREAELREALKTAAPGSKEEARAKKALSDYLTQIERERLLLSREDQKTALRNEIEQIVRNRDAERMRVQEALDGQLLIDKKYQEGLLASDLNTLTKKKENLDEALKQELIDLDKQRIEKIAIEEALVAGINEATAKLLDRTIVITTIERTIREGGGGSIISNVPMSETGSGGTFIPKMATGGIIPEPTLLTSIRTLRPYAIAGEAGPERVSPMGGLSGVLVTGNNFYVRQEADIDRIAESIVRKAQLAQGLKI